jgi:lipid II:glycine glycyltransferase (peptidoglycan interpeptide bridge formation enzyme)
VSLTVRKISAAQHQAWASDQPWQSFLQLPSWGPLKADWTHESIGWFDDDHLVSAALVLYRPVPRLRYRLAYLPEGPSLDLIGDGAPSRPLTDWLNPLVKHLKSRKAFAVKMGPPMAVRRWSADALKEALADENAGSIGAVEPTWTNEAGTDVVGELVRLGWRRAPGGGAGFGDVQPRFIFAVPLAGRTQDDIWNDLNQLWRRNVRKAEKAGVEVTLGTRDELALFHEVYVETAERDGFLPRPLSYFHQMWDAMNDAVPGQLALYLARHEGVVHASTLRVRVGTHDWYSYGASTTAGRDLRPSNAVQWRMITDAHAAGASVYDLRGISDTLDAQDKLRGLLQFKIGTGGYAQEYLGEWDLPLNALLYRMFVAAMARR